MPEEAGNKPIAQMTRREALPGLREEAAGANARVHEATERVVVSEEVPTHVASTATTWW